MSDDVEQISHLFRKTRLGHERRGSDESAKAFHLAPNYHHISPRHSIEILPSSGRESPGRNCQLHIPHGVNPERRGSTGNIHWRKSSSPQPPAFHHHHHLFPNENRRGSTPGDVLLFPTHRKDSRKFSQDSIELNEPSLAGNGHKTWKTSQGTIIEEEVNVFFSYL